jgi:hypothetical protein
MYTLNVIISKIFRHLHKLNLPHYTLLTSELMKQNLVKAAVTV